MDSSVLYKLAYELHYTDQNYGEALKVYKKIVNEYPNSPEAEYAKTQVLSIEKLTDKKSQMNTLKPREQEQNFRADRSASRLNSREPEQTMVHRPQAPAYPSNQTGFVQSPQTSYEAAQQRLSMSGKQPANYPNNAQYQTAPEQGAKLPTTPEEYNWAKNQNKTNPGDNDQARRAVEARLRGENYPQESIINQPGYTNVAKNVAPTNTTNTSNISNTNSGNTESQASFKTIQNFKTFFEDQSGTTSTPNNNINTNQSISQPEMRPIGSNSPQTINNNVTVQNPAYAWSQPSQGGVANQLGSRDPRIAEQEAAAVLANNLEQPNQQVSNQIKKSTPENVSSHSKKSDPRSAEAPFPNESKSSVTNLESKHSKAGATDLASLQENLDILSRDLKNHKNGLAVAFSAILPGLGQIYSGMFKQGIVWVASWTVALLMLFSLSFGETPTGVVFKGLGIRQLILIAVMFIVWAFNIRQISRSAVK